MYHLKSSLHLAWAQRQENLCVFKASLVYRVSSTISGVSKKKKKKSSGKITTNAIPASFVDRIAFHFLTVCAHYYSSY